MSERFEATGHCLCGEISFTAKFVSPDAGACHCSMCRRWGGGPLLATDCGTEVEFSGKEYLGVYNSSEWAERGFCTKCGTHLFYRLKESGQVIMPVGVFESEEKFRFAHQIFTDKKPSYYSFANQTENMTEEEVFAKYTS